VKKLILVFTLFFAGLSYGQDYRYQFKLSGVTNLGEAKYSMIYFRQKFDAFPAFNDSTDTFDFISTANVSQSELATAVAAGGYIVLFYERSILPTEGIDEK